MDDARLHLSREQLADLLVAIHRHERKELWGRVFTWVATALSVGLICFVIWRHL
jgi:hypothetical protein